MPLYTYQALSPAGKRRRGVVDATSINEAKEKLRDQGVMVTLLSQGRARGKRFQLTRQQLVQRGKHGVCQKKAHERCIPPVHLFKQDRHAGTGNRAPPGKKKPPSFYMVAD